MARQSPPFRYPPGHLNCHQIIIDAVWLPARDYGGILFVFRRWLGSHGLSDSSAFLPQETMVDSVGGGSVRMRRRALQALWELSGASAEGSEGSGVMMEFLHATAGSSMPVSHEAHPGDEVCDAQTTRRLAGPSPRHLLGLCPTVGCHSACPQWLSNSQLVPTCVGKPLRAGFQRTLESHCGQA